MRYFTIFLFLGLMSIALTIVGAIINAIISKFTDKVPKKVATTVGPAASIDDRQSPPYYFKNRYDTLDPNLEPHKAEMCPIHNDAYVGYIKFRIEKGGDVANLLKGAMIPSVSYKQDPDLIGYTYSPVCAKCTEEAYRYSKHVWFRSEYEKRPTTVFDGVYSHIKGLQCAKLVIPPSFWDSSIPDSALQDKLSSIQKQQDQEAQKSKAAQRKEGLRFILLILYVVSAASFLLTIIYFLSAHEISFLWVSVAIITLMLALGIGRVKRE